MTTCRDVLTDAFGAMGVIAFGGQPSADELDGGLLAIGAVVLDLHGAQSPLRSVDVSTDYLASENESVRVALGADVVITLPNSVQAAGEIDGSDYGFGSTADSSLTIGSSNAADGRLLRPPRDGARVEIVGLTQALYFYRSDTNAWVPVGPLAIDGPTPLNSRYDGALAALVAERLCDPMNVTPSAALAKRIARGNATLLVRPATAQARPRPAYL